MASEAAIWRVKETFENWAMYEAVIKYDYMRHRDLVTGLKQIGAAMGVGLAVIDLGCGDAWLATEAFRNLPVASYLGIDLSESAVERARQNLQNSKISGQMICGNLVEAIAKLEPQSANLVLASNSLHHFDQDIKATILGHCYRVVSRGGMLCWIDPVRNAQESREEYLARLTDIILKDWVALPEAARQQAAKHVWESDYPETEAEMKRIGQAAGFVARERFLHDELFGGWAFEKADILSSISTANLC